jgi:4-hydroxy-tetrahydrodipicolinate reductase
MGKELLALLETPRFTGRCELVSNPKRGEGLDSLKSADVWIDFSSPSGTLEWCREAKRYGGGKLLISGTTGWAAEELKELNEAAQVVPILYASNFSLGIQICKTTLRAWGGHKEIADWKVTLRDIHHAGKKDSPSGTALSLREALGPVLGAGAVILSERHGEVVGTHEVILESPSEKLTLTHTAKSRSVFAEGALEAALRIASLNLTSLPRRLLGLDDL